MIVTGRGTSAKPYQRSCAVAAVLNNLIGYLSPSLSSSRVSTTEVMPGTLLATSFA